MPVTQKVSSVAISVCVINYNGLDHLKESLAALESVKTDFDEILIVDNASTDGSVEYITSLPQVRLIAMATNTGPAGARNAGFKEAKNNIILFLDNDVCLTDGVVEGLYEGLTYNEKTLVTMPCVLYRSDPDIIQYEGADCHFLGLMSLRNANVKREQAKNEAAVTSSMVSACFMIDRSRYHEPLLFDETLIFNLEDHDLGVRANLLGYNTVVVPSVAVLHGSGTAGLSYRPGIKANATRMYCLIRNRWWIIVRYFSLRTLIILSPILLLFELWQVAGLVLKGWGREWWQALVDTRRQFVRLCEERKSYQKKRQRSDADILRFAELPLTKAIGSGFVTRIFVKLFESTMYLYWHLVKGLL